jgi:hypothetical protein
LDLQSTALKAWQLVENSFNDLQHGLSISHETLSNLLSNAKETIVINPDLEGNTYSLLQEGEKENEKCVSALSNIHTITEHNLNELNSLLEIVKHYPVHTDSISSVRSKHEIIKTVLSAQEMLGLYHNKFTPEILPEEKLLLNARDIKKNLIKLENYSQNENEHHEVTKELKAFNENEINEIKQQFFILEWHMEMMHLFYQEKKIPFTQAEKLKIFGEKISVQTVLSDEWNLFQNALNALYSFQTRVKNFETDFNAKIVEFNKSMNDLLAPQQKTALVQDELRLNETSFHYVQTNLLNCYCKLHLFMKENGDSLRAIQQYSHDTKNELIVTDEENNLKLLELIDFIEILQFTASILSKAFPVANNETTPSSGPEMVELKEIISVLNKFSALTNVFPDLMNLEFVNELHTAMRYLHQESSTWEQKYSHFLPLKPTRLMKSSRNNESTLPTPNDVILILQEPIATLIRTTLHERFYNVMAQAHLFRLELISLLIDSDNQDENKMAIDGEVGSSTEQDDNDADVDEKLTEKLTTLSELKQKLDFFPMEIPESLVLQWSMDILNWLRNVPHPGDTAEDFTINIFEAQQLLRAANPLINEIPEKMVYLLADLGIMNLDETKGPIGLHPKTYIYIKNSANYYEFLQEQVDQCEEFQKTLESAINKDIQNLALKKYLEIWNSLLVHPDPNMKKSLEKMYQSKSSGGAIDKFTNAVVTKSGRSSKRKLAGDYYFDGSLDALQSRNREAFEEMPPLVSPSKSFDEVEVKDKERMKKRTSLSNRPKCGSCTRELKSASHTSFCTSKCTFKAAAELFNALLAVKKILTSDNNYTPFEGMDTLKADLEACKLRSEPATPIPTSENESGKSTPSVLSKNLELKSLLSKLPSVAHSFLIWGEKGETEAPSSSSKKKEIQSEKDLDQGLRLKAKSILEEIFMSALTKQKMEGSLFLGALFATELEESLYAKYFKNGLFDRKEYRKHQQMLMHSLRQVHNEQLVSSIF